MEIQATDSMGGFADRLPPRGPDRMGFPGSSSSQPDIMGLLYKDYAWTTVVNLSHCDGQNGAVGEIKNWSPRGNALNFNGGVFDNQSHVFGVTSLLRTTGVTATPCASTTSHADYQFLTFDFCAEFKFKIPILAAARLFDMSFGGGGDTAQFMMNMGSTGDLVYRASGANRIVTKAGLIKPNTWQSYAYARVNGVGRLFIDGQIVGSWLDTINYNGTSGISCASNNTNPLDASWDEIRVSNGAFGYGAGRYAFPYNPSPGPFAHPTVTP